MSRVTDWRPAIMKEKVIRMELTEIQKRIFDRVKENWELRLGKGNVDKEKLAEIIRMADTDGDGMKRVEVIGKGTYLVPIEDIILVGVSVDEIDKYPRVMLGIGG